MPHRGPSRRARRLFARLPVLVLLAAQGSGEYAPPAAPAAAIADSPVCRVDGGVFINGSRAGNGIALTFDLCPTHHAPPFAPDLIAFLKKAQVPATFFVSGAWARANPRDLKALEDSPLFEIALHGDYHRHLPAGKPGSEIAGGERTLARLGVSTVPLFRPPYGDAPPELPTVSHAEHIWPVMWDVELGDPNPRLSAVVLEREMLRWAQAGSIVVLHANGRGTQTPQALRALVPALRARGYSFVHVSDLMRECGLSSP